MHIGIDLGTTNSAVGIFGDDGVELIPNVFGDVLTPSVVGLSDDGEVLVGRAAADRLVTHPNLTTASFKRFMGTNRVIEIGGKRFRPEELSALVLQSLVADVREATGQEVTSAVISVPAYFNDTQRRATATAGEIAGINVARLINEPTAAALAYGLHDASDESTFLVFDVGGGTFDVSVLELFEGVMEVHASAGDNFLGGEDFVDALVEHFKKATGHAELGTTELAGLRASSERAKRSLNKEPSATLRTNIGGEPVEAEVTKAQYEEIVMPLLQRLRRPVERALRDARLRVADLDEIVLVGGSTRKHIIQRLVAQMFGRLPLRHIDPDEVVARGAAVQAGLVSRHEALDDVVMTDVCPYTLGVEVATEVGGMFQDGLFSPILERNTVVPASREERYYPVNPEQRTVELNIYQGESRRVAENVHLGKLDVPLPKKGDKSEKAIDVRFSYDASGLLEVQATVIETGKQLQLVITQSAGKMSDADVKKALKKLESLKIHPRDQDENVAVVNRASRLYEELIGAEREAVGRALSEFEGALAGQDPRVIREARSHFTALLDRLESDMKW